MYLNDTKISANYCDLNSVATLLVRVGRFISDEFTIGSELKQGDALGRWRKEKIWVVKSQYQVTPMT